MKLRGPPLKRKTNLRGPILKRLERWPLLRELDRTCNACFSLFYSRVKEGKRQGQWQFSNFITALLLSSLSSDLSLLLLSFPTSPAKEALGWELILVLAIPGSPPSVIMLLEILQNSRKEKDKKQHFDHKGPGGIM